MGLDRICKGCGIEKPLSDFSKNKESKDGHRWKCKPCMNEMKRLNRASNLEAHLEKERKYYRDNKETLDSYTKEYREKNTDHIKAYHKQYYTDHEDEKLIYSKEYYEENKAASMAYSLKWGRENKESRKIARGKYADKNLEKYKQWARNSALARKTQSPVYADRVKMDIKYRASRIMTKLTGKMYCVDHIIPIQGELASGLHHEDNLQVIPMITNSAKGNRFVPGFISWELKHVV